jgi:hypothetical protein
MQLVSFLPTFNALCMRLKIRCDGWKKKYFGFACQVNRAIIRLLVNDPYKQSAKDDG